MNTLDQFAMAALAGIMASKQSREPHHHAQDVSDAYDLAEKMLAERTKRYPAARSSSKRQSDTKKPQKMPRDTEEIKDENAAPEFRPLRYDDEEEAK